MGARGDRSGRSERGGGSCPRRRARAIAARRGAAVGGRDGRRGARGRRGGRRRGGVADGWSRRAMDGAAFTAALTPRGDSFGPTGGDEIEFLIAPNPGVPAGPLRDTASGGELSRVMLALMGVAAEAGPGTLVFD